MVLTEFRQAHSESWRFDQWLSKPQKLLIAIS